MSQYARYIEERTNARIIENEYGFVRFSFLDTAVYIEDIFIEKEYRQTDKASKLANEVAQIARDSGYKTMIGSVCTDAKGADISVKVLYGYGMTLHSATNNMIYFKKNIEE